MRDMTKHVRTSCLEVAYEDRGSAQAEPIMLAHGFPDDSRTWDAVVAPLGEAGYRALAYWYQWYFGLERGHVALKQDRRRLCRWLWEAWSPGWHFDDATFETTARSFDNPDFVEISIHSYRHRWGNAPGDRRYDEIEARMATLPRIGVDTTVLHGADDGATFPETSAGKERLFTGPYERRGIKSGGPFAPRARRDAR